SRNGNRSFTARRCAKSGTRSGCRSEGMQVTQSGDGRGSHWLMSDSHAVTKSSAKHPSQYFPLRTNWPHPASPQTQSARPSEARFSAEISPAKPYRGIPPVGHLSRGSIGKLVRRRNLMASSAKAGLTHTGKRGEPQGRTL